METLRQSQTVAVLVLVAVLLIVWYIAAIFLNAPVILDRLSRDGVTPSIPELVLQTWSYTRPVLPAPHQILIDPFNTTLTLAPTSKRSLLYHAWITLSATLLGFVMGTILGVLLAVGLNTWLMMHYEMARIPMLYVLSGVLAMLAIGQAAVFVPARRASNVPPVVATRAV